MRSLVSIALVLVSFWIVAIGLQESSGARAADWLLRGVDRNDGSRQSDEEILIAQGPLEVPVAAPHPNAARHIQSVAVQPAPIWSFGPFHSVQVNIDAQGNDIINDAANEPSMAIDPNDPSRVVIGWRQFDTIFDPNAFRQAGVSYSHDGGLTWSATTLDPGQFRSDPVLAADNHGNFFYSSLPSLNTVELFKSVDGGVSWSAPVYAFGGDKQWITVDRSGGLGDGFIYQTWNSQFSCCPPNDFTRSTDGGASFPTAFRIPTPSLKWGTLDVGPNGELYVFGSNLGQTGYVVAKSVTVSTDEFPAWTFVKSVDLGGTVGLASGPNPAGILGQGWVATDHSTGTSRGNVYLLSSVNPPGMDPLDVMFVRSTNGGVTFSTPIRVNDDPQGLTAFQWFGAMSVAPGGRIDVIYYDTQVDPTTTVRYTASFDAGATWTPSTPITPSFDRSLGYPNQLKIGDYCQLISDDLGASLAYTATFNGGQDVYFLKIDRDCNANQVNDSIDIANGTSTDCNVNQVPDDCDLATRLSADCNVNEIPDSCDIASGESSDGNNNTIPDECECVIDPVAQEPVPVDKNRYISFVPGSAGLMTALRVTFVDLPPPFEAFEGARKWIAAPRDVLETPNPATFFHQAGLSCSPEFFDWGSLGTVHVSDRGIVPGAEYEIQAVQMLCDPKNEENYTVPLSVRTVALWGDVVQPFSPPSDTTQPDFGDVAVVVDKFKDAPGAVLKARGDLYPDVPDQSVNFSDISVAVDAFRGFPYPFDGPSGCP